jgi:serine/threonine-protein kinase
MATCPTCRTHYADDVAVCENDGSHLLPDASFSAADVEIEPEEMIGEYRVERKLGEGGFGTVYRAVQPLIGKPVAIKVLSRQFSSNPQIVSRFIAEARAVNQIRHKNIIDIFSFGALPDGRQYYVMELLEGVPLDVYVAERGRLRPDEAIPLLRGVARALDAAHSHGIAHRDLKPENIFVVFEDDGALSPKLLDFGIAKLMGDSMSGPRTQTGAPLGTPFYMSPEQCRGEKVDHRTDIYSFGVVLHQILTGKLPFDAPSMMAILMKHLTEPPPHPSQVCTELRSELDAPILHMLAKDAGERPPTVSAALEALALAAQEAGYAVDVQPVRSVPSSGGKAGAVVGKGGMTPAELQRLAVAQTQAHSAGGDTMQAAITGSHATGGRRALPLAIGAVVALLLIGVGLVLRAGGAGSPAAPAPESTPKAAVTAPPPAAPPSTASAPRVAPAESSEVDLTIESTPPAAEVWLADRKLGTAPGPVKVARGKQPIQLTFKAAGWQPKHVPITPSANAVVSVTLARVARQAQPKKKGDLEF